MPGLDDWLTLASSAEADELRESILTGFKHGKPFTPYVPTVPWPSGVARVLDFGCGVGRNFPYLRRVADCVDGFDLPPMIARCRALADRPPDALYDDWAVVRARRYDLIYASLVLQHIDTEMCRRYLDDFASMAPVVYLLTRGETDFGRNVFDLVAEAGRYRVDECVEVNHDPDTHQLRVLGRVTCAEARDAAPGGHYEALMWVEGT